MQLCKLECLDPMLMYIFDYIKGAQMCDDKGALTQSAQNLTAELKVIGIRNIRYPVQLLCNNCKQTG